MKTIILGFLLLGVVAFAEDEHTKEHLIAVFCNEENIDGTILSKWNTFSTDSKDGTRSYSCDIGYTQDIGGQSTFVPVLELPSLKEDERYDVLCKNGVLTITTSKGKAFVAKLDLNKLAPSLITKKLAEPITPEQPATAPESKPESKEKPKTKSSESGPRE